MTTYIIIAIIVLLVWWFNQEQKPPTGKWGDDEVTIIITDKVVSMTRPGIATDYVITSTKKMGSIYLITMIGKSSPGGKDEVVMMSVRLRGTYLEVLGIHMRKVLPPIV